MKVPLMLGWNYWPLWQATSFQNRSSDAL